jgi:O-succinylbenzoate synthase
VGTAWHVLSDFFIPTLLEEGFEELGSFRDRLQQYKGHPLARAGLELALWDLAAQEEGKSLASLLGGVLQRVPVGVSIGLQQDPQTLVAAVEQYLEQGYQRVKIKIKPGRDRSEVKAVRSAWSELPLQVDANSAYRLSDITIFQALDVYELLLIEQPFAEDDLVDHSHLQSRLKTPICLDESIRSARHARQALEIDACRVINIKPGRVGGIAEAVAIHDLSLAKNIPVWCGGMLETGIGRAANLALASLPGFKLPGDISATDRYYEVDIAEPRFSLNRDSTIDVPIGMGLGVDIVRDALDRVTVHREVFRAGG